MGCSNSTTRSEGPHRYQPPPKHNLVNPKDGLSASHSFGGGWDATNGFLDAPACHSWPPDAVNTGQAWYQVTMHEPRLIGGLIFQNGPNSWGEWALEWNTLRFPSRTLTQARACTCTQMDTLHARVASQSLWTDRLSGSLWLSKPARARMPTANRSYSKLPS